MTFDKNSCMYNKIDQSKNMATRGRGQFPQCTYVRNFKIFFCETSGQNSNQFDRNDHWITFY